MQNYSFALLLYTFLANPSLHREDRQWFLHQTLNFPQRLTLTKRAAERAEALSATVCSGDRALANRTRPCIAGPDPTGPKLLFKRAAEKPESFYGAIYKRNYITLAGMKTARSISFLMLQNARLSLAVLLQTIIAPSQCLNTKCFRCRTKTKPYCFAIAFNSLFII
jgi:hypothetical protein